MRTRSGWAAAVAAIVMAFGCIGGLPGGQYLDSTGAAKTGYCVCQAPNANGARTWSCAQDTSWPCPLGSGC